MSGGAGIGAATSLSAIAATIGGTGSGFSVLITSFNPGGNYSTEVRAFPLDAKGGAGTRLHAR